MRKGITYSCVLYLSCASGVWASGAFTNLNFESASLVPIPGDPYGSVYFSPALPGWSGFSGTNQLSAALHDNLFLDSTGIAILDSNWQPPIQGNYTIFLEAGLELYSGPQVPADATQDPP